MKNILALLLICSFSLTFAQKKTNLKAFLDHKSFYNPEIGNYVEIQLQFVAYSLNFKAVDVGLKSEVSIQYVFKQKNEVVLSDAYRLQSPLMKDSIIEDFYDIKRVAIKPGEYKLELTLTDLNSEKPPITAVQDIVIEDLSTKISLSNIVTAETIYKSEVESVFTKSGYDLIPRISNYFSADANKIPIYFEMYCPKSELETNSFFGIKQSIKSQRTNQEIESFTRFSKHEASEIQPIIRAIDISKLPTGEYNLVLSLINSKNEEIDFSNYYFERFSNEEYQEVSTENIVLDPNFQNSITDDSLAYYIASLIPISKPAEVKNIITLLKTKDKSLYRKYMQSYWTNTTSGFQVNEKWLNYKQQVMNVEKLFATNFTAGYENDRGRVFLQYGPPSSVTVRENSPSEYPYEIWRYDKILNFSNKRFVFYNPDLVNNMYKLLHSDMRGELQNYRWQQHLSKRNSTNTNIDSPGGGNVDHFGGNSNTLYNEY